MSPVELLASVFTVGILLLLVTILIDRSFALQRSRDLLRTNHVQQIMGGILQYQVDHAGAMPQPIQYREDGKAYMIGIPREVCTNTCPNHPVADECFDLGALAPTYLPEIPQDPFFTELGPSGYYIYKHKSNVLTVGACVTEASAVLEATR